jgi:hypothetical protein
MSVYEVVHAFPIFGVDNAGTWTFAVLNGLVMVAPAVVIGVLVAVGMPGPSPDIEPRCRKCRYMLRGLKEPRCPECGEPI